MIQKFPRVSSRRLFSVRISFEIVVFAGWNPFNRQNFLLSSRVSFSDEAIHFIPEVVWQGRIVDMHAGIRLSRIISAATIRMTSTEKTSSRFIQFFGILGRSPIFTSMLGDCLLSFISFSVFFSRIRNWQRSQSCRLFYTFLKEKAAYQKLSKL